MDNRRSDWHDSVDERLVNLTSAQKSADADLTTLREEMLKFDEILRGDENHDGLIEKVNLLSKEVNKFNALLYRDSAGNPGILKKIDAVLDDRERADKQTGYRWAFRTAFWPVVVVQLLVLIGLVVVNWDKIQEYIVLHEHIYQAAAIERNTKKLKAKRKKKPKPPPVEEVPEASDGSGTD